MTSLTEMVHAVEFGPGVPDHAILTLIEIARTALVMREARHAYVSSGWLSADNPLFQPFQEAIAAHEAALAAVSP